MVPPIRLLVCGSSLFLLAMESLLRALPGMVVECVSSYHPDVLARLHGQPPDAVLFEWEQPGSERLWSLLLSGVPLLAIDPAIEQVTLFHRSTSAVEQVSDLLALIPAKVSPEGR